MPDAMDERAEQMRMTACPHGSPIPGHFMGLPQNYCRLCLAEAFRTVEAATWEEATQELQQFIGMPVSLVEPAMKQLMKEFRRRATGGTP